MPLKILDLEQVDIAVTAPAKKSIIIKNYESVNVDLGRFRKIAKETVICDTDLSKTPPQSKLISTLSSVNSNIIYIFFYEVSRTLQGLPFFSFRTSNFVLLILQSLRK